MGKPFHPEEYGMTVCLECKGNGKLLMTPEGMKVCHKCGGFGYIKKEENSIKKLNGKFAIDKR